MVYDIYTQRQPCALAAPFTQQYVIRVLVHKIHMSLWIHLYHIGWVVQRKHVGAKLSIKGSAGYPCER